MLKKFNEGFKVGLANLMSVREFFNVCYQRSRFWKINSEIIKISHDFPIVASSTFLLEKDPEGIIVNDIPDLKAKPKPTFFTVFPQGRSTYCIISWKHSNNQDYKNIPGISNEEEKVKRAVVSNLLTAYVENFAINPTYWNELPKEVIQKFKQYQGLSAEPDYVSFLYDADFNIFLDIE